MDVGGEGSPVLLVMGLGMAGAMWAPILPALRASHRVATFDHRGLGSRVDEPPARTMGELADDVLATLDALGWERAHLVGVSMGGMASQEVVVRRPDRIASLALIATTACGRKVLPPTRSALLAVLGSREREDRLAQLLYPPAYRREHRAEIDRRVASMVATMAPRATTRAHFRAVLGHDARQRLKTVRAPTLVMKPGLDAMIRPTASDDLARRVPHARLAVLPDAGHGLIHQSADRVASLLLEHLARSEA
ncbi:MAG: alpha/beta fold hydrolase [Alphaproteobacteria bacterium]|nr:alpha/beta fold hydrolase [Alphaproteobacteria bacterium]MCB9699073.1 alpha/beta fold hydrolase [Alphaproteobacteria bacterium]